MYLSFLKKTLQGRVQLPSSKSESNRGLMIQALSGSTIKLDNLSEANDTQVMQRVLRQAMHSEDMMVLDVEDAGTVARFLTAFCAAKGISSRIVGTNRMYQRPIGILVDALRQLGANITYQHQEGYLPLTIVGESPLSGGNIQLRGDVSSQYISALLMIAPLLPNGLQLSLVGEIGSRPYIDMTMQLMRHFGADCHWRNANELYVHAIPYVDGQYSIEADWSAASYWYSMVALAEDADVLLLGLRETSLQGDKQIAEWMRYLGVETSFTAEGARLRKVAPLLAAGDTWQLDVAHCPDLAQTLAVVAAAKGIELLLSGTASLRIKETDRLAALAAELHKINQLTPHIETYEDHRMAMAFAPLALVRSKIYIQNPAVVAKSYPRFWEHLATMGGELER